MWCGEPGQGLQNGVVSVLYYVVRRCGKSRSEDETCEVYFADKISDVHWLGLRRFRRLTGGYRIRAAQRRKISIQG